MKIIKLKAGQTVPTGAKYLGSGEEPDFDNISYEYKPRLGYWGTIYTSGIETKHRIIRMSKFDYYEVNE